MNRHILYALTAIGSLAACDAALAGERVLSKYTSTAERTSITFKYDDAEYDRSAFSGLFRGFDGYQIEHLCADERSWVNIKFGDKHVDLYKATMEAGAATGSFPHKANDVVEWRGIEHDGHFKPYAIIYRLVGVDENGKRKRSRLIVIKLDKEHSAVIGCTEGANEEAEAHKLADQARGGAAK